MRPRAPFFSFLSGQGWGLARSVVPASSLRRMHFRRGPPAHLLVFDADQSRPRCRPRGRLGVEGGHCLQSYKHWGSGIPSKSQQGRELWWGGRAPDPPSPPLHPWLASAAPSPSMERPPGPGSDQIADGGSSGRSHSQVLGATPPQSDLGVASWLAGFLSWSSHLLLWPPPVSALRPSLSFSLPSGCFSSSSWGTWALDAEGPASQAHFFHWASKCLLLPVSHFSHLKNRQSHRCLARCYSGMKFISAQQMSYLQAL